MMTMRLRSRCGAVAMGVDLSSVARLEADRGRYDVMEVGHGGGGGRAQRRRKESARAPGPLGGGSMGPGSGNPGCRGKGNSGGNPSRRGERCHVG